MGAAAKQQELQQAPRRSKVETRRDDPDTARSAVLFADTHSRLQLLPEEHEYQEQPAQRGIG